MIINKYSREVIESSSLEALKTQMDGHIAEQPALASPGLRRRDGLGNLQRSLPNSDFLW